MGMYILRRLGYMAITMVVVTILGYIIIELPPGSYVESEILRLRRQGGNLAPSEIEALYRRYGLDKPAYERFGLWISFYPFSQDDYLAAVASWLAVFGLGPSKSAREEETRTRDALQYALQRGSRSGRVAWQFAKGCAGAAALKRKHGA